MSSLENRSLDDARPLNEVASREERAETPVLLAPRTSKAHRRLTVRRALVVADITALIVTFGICEILFQPNPAVGTHVSTGVETGFFLLLLPVWIAVACLYGLYGRDEQTPAHGTVDDVVGVFHMISAGLALLVVLGVASDVVHPSISKIVTFWLLAFALVILARVGARTLCRRHDVDVQKAVIVGAGDVGQLVAHKIRQHPEYRIDLVGFVDDAPRDLRPGLTGLPVLGRTDQLAALVESLDVERVIVAFTKDHHDSTLALIRSLNELDVQIDIVPRLFELLAPTVDVHTLEGLPLIGLRHPSLSRPSRLLKRVIDVAGAGIGLIVLTPFFAYAAFRIRRESPGPAIFRQARVGTDGQTFSMYKFRTMRADAEERKAEFAHLNVHRLEGADATMFKIPHDPRVTRFGSWLRRYSLDELPQLINVVRGEMSLVGPRPLIPEEAAHVSDWARKRLAPKPGITGLWQVLGRSDIPFEEMTKLDYLYVTNWSLWGDLRLLFQTIPAVLRSPRVD